MESRCARADVHNKILAIGSSRVGLGYGVHLTRRHKDIAVPVLEDADDRHVAFALARVVDTSRQLGLLKRQSVKFLSKSNQFIFGYFDPIKIFFDNKNKKKSG